MSVKIIGIRIVSASHPPCWEVAYKVLDKTSAMTVYAESESEARAKATESLERQRLPEIPDDSWLDEHLKRKEAELPRNWQD
jgi:hypothetical protein